MLTKPTQKHVTNALHIHVNIQVFRITTWLHGQLLKISYILIQTYVHLLLPLCRSNIVYYRDYQS